MASHSVSPFDIPPIVDLIGQHLCRRDVLNCILVNKQFHKQFNRWCWRSVRVKFYDFAYTEEVIPQSLIPTFQKKLFENRHHIRNLDISESNEGELLMFIANTLSPFNLFSLRYMTFNAISGPHVLLLLSSLVEKNTALQDLHIGPLCHSFQPQLIRHITNLSSLTTLKLKDHLTVHRNDYRALLQRLPEVLQTFELAWWIKNNAEVNEIGHFPDIGWCDAYTRLRNISLAAHKDATLSLFLQRCPALEKLVIVHEDEVIIEELCPLLADTRIFPRLTSIDIRESIVSEDSELIDWRRLGSAMRGHVTAISIDTFNLLDIGNLCDNWASTLETLRIGPDAIDMSPGSIELILTTCSRLKTLAILSYGESDEQNIGYWTWCDGVYNDSKDNWICLGLEHLDLTFLDIRARSFDTIYHQRTNGYNSSQLELYTFNGIHKAFYQLGRLTKLRHLRLGWISDTAFKRKVNFDLSISSGLEHLAGLKELEILDVTCIAHVNIEEEEVKWMTENWPMLRMIKGYFKKFPRLCHWDRDEDDLYEDIYPTRREEPYIPTPIRWLLSRRPHLEIS
ncbi:hypothetical protein BGX21_006113 [Mortierella sp. AD011]|nr:hypothetical protein BGX21_006113 [Mortierella sp. AD011]